MIATNEQVARAYDAIASEYDAQLGGNPVAAYMRAQLHAHFARVFSRGNRVLDFTAGTGLDALFLAARGVCVTATDVSPGMIAELRQSAAAGGLPIDVRVIAAEQLGQWDDPFDGAISTFAGLNLIADLPRVVENLARAIRPGGRVILHGFNQTCFWYAAANRLQRRGARSGQLHVGTTIVTHRLYDPFALWHTAFERHFNLREAYALSVIAAPALVKRFARLAPALFWIDRVVGRMAPAAGDFFVLDLERRE